MKKNTNRKTAETYADALFQIALEADCLTKTAEELSFLSQIEEIKKIGSPFLEKEKQEELIEMLCTQSNLGKTSMDFLYLLLDHKALNLLPNISDCFNKKVLDHHGIVKILVETVQPLTTAQEKKLLDGLKKILQKDVILSYKINENLFGGLILHYNAIQIDDSLRGKLKKIESIMKGS